MRKLLAGRIVPLLLLAVLLIVIVPVAVFAAASTATPLDISRVATEMTWTQAVTDGVKFANNGRVMLLLRSHETSSDATVVITTQATYRGYALEDATFTLDHDSTMVIGPFPMDVFNDSDGNVTVVAVEGAGSGTTILISVTAIRF